MGIEQEGSIAFRLRHADPDWATNNKPYRFNTVESGPIRAWAMKNADGTVEFHVSGPLKSEIVLDGKMRWKRRKPAPQMYDYEHVELFKSIRSGTPINNGDYMCKSTMMAIMARMSAYSGKSVKWDDAWNSTESFTPKSYEFGPFPVAPVAIPGGDVA